jgi:16S rRNA processing protein RimM
MSAPGQQEQWVWLARIRRPQGRKGEVFADILTDFPEKFAQRRRLWLVADPESPPQSRPESPRPKGNPAPVKGTGLGPYIQSAQKQGALAPEGIPREVELQAHWLHKGGIVLHFALSSSISDAENLAGLIVAIPLEQRAPLAEDEVYIADLIGCTLVDVSGPAPATIGQIADVDRTAGPVALLVVSSPACEAEILIPFAKSYLRRLDLEAKRVEMALPEGLAELNTSGKG